MLLIFLLKIGVSENILSVCSFRCELEVMPNKSPISRTDLLNKISGKHGIFCFLTDKIDKEVLDQAGNISC